MIQVSVHVVVVALLVASLRALWLWISGALSAPPPLVDGRRVFRMDRVYLLALGAAHAAVFFALAWACLVLAIPMHWGFLIAMLLFAILAVLTVFGTKTRIILDGDTITSILPFRAPRSEALDDMTAVRLLNVMAPHTRSSRRTMATSLRIVDMRHRGWLTIPAMMPGGRWLFALLQAHLAARNAEPTDAASRAGLAQDRETTA